MSFPTTILFLQDDGAAGKALGAGMGAGMLIFWLVLLVVMIAAIWKVFEKAGEPGWASIVPIYNFIVLLKIAGKPVWWIILMLIPFVNFVIIVLIVLAVARNFGKSGGFAIGLLLLPFIFYPMLAWGDASYHAVAPATA